MIRIGTRGSALAMAQARWVAERIGDAELVTINAVGPVDDKSRWVSALERALLDDEIDVKMLRDRIGAMRKAATELSVAQKKKVDVPWGRLEEDPDETPDMLWTVAKKVTPKVLSELRPLVSDTPEAAFLISPEKKAPVKKKRATARKRKK